jgi:hypothetical protein
MIHRVYDPGAFLGPGSLSNLFPPALAQVALPGIDGNLVNVALNLAGAVLILLLGWIVAAWLASIVRGLLDKTSLDEKISNITADGQGAGQTAPLSVAGIAATVTFWVVMVLAIVAALNVLKLTTVSEPLNNFLNQIFAYLPKLGGALILAAIAWLVATLCKLVAVRTASSFNLDQRLTQATDDPGTDSQFRLSETLGNALYWFVLLFFLPLILGVLELQGPLQPVQSLLNDFLSALPNIIKAIAIGVVGWFVAKIVRDIVTNLLAAVGTDRLGRRVGLVRGSSGQSLSSIIGLVVYVLILIPVAIAALEALRISSVTVPASAMLNQILGAIPQIFTAGVILAIGYAIGQFVKDLLTNLLTGLGFNNVLYWLGIRSEPPMQIPPPPPADPTDTSPMLIEPDAARFGARTPSEIAGLIALVGIILFSAVIATDVLRIPALTGIVGGLLVLLGQVLVGVLIFGIGLYLANLVYSVVASSGSAQAKLLGQTARIAILALVSAMALKQIGIAPSIVDLAFGLLLGAIAVAIAIAFGLGGRDVAAEQLREWLNSFKSKY